MRQEAIQLSLFEEISNQFEEQANQSQWGTFKDSLKAPIHSWFTYPAGFSYKAVEYNLRLNKIKKENVIYDPFMGSGTTNVTAKILGINSYGIEAHPFVFKIARTKLNWKIKRSEIFNAIKIIANQINNQKKQSDEDIKDYLKNEFPELVLKCYENKTLLDLLLIRNTILDSGFQPDLIDLLLTGLTSVLRQLSIAATGWPYIAPKKIKTTSFKKDALLEYSRCLLKMIDDIEITIEEANKNSINTFHNIFNNDSRNTTKIISSNSIDNVFTSPPYLNNFDYADRTRLELYFFGEARTWSDITKNVRTKLITSATTQITRDDPHYILSKDLLSSCPQVYYFLEEAVAKLGKLRLIKGGRKSYDHLVSGYFNDMYLVLTDIFRVLKNGTKAVFVLGDSAPYGVYIPTDELIGKIGVSVGFSNYTINMLRSRGEKWKGNSQRHTVQLRESVVTLSK
jgi:DNA modification methylase